MYTSGLTLWSRWKYIKKIARRPYGFTLQEGLIVDKLMIRYKKKGIGYIPNMFSKYPRTKPFIPLSCLADNWRTTELEQQIKEYAPHLFN